jgi:hypothetical protein
VDAGKCQEADTAVVIGKGRIVYDGRIYRTNSPYVTIGYGGGYGFRTKLYQQNMGFSLHYFIKKVGLQLGYHASSDLPPWWRSFQKLNDVYLCGGRKWDQSPKWNFALFAGPSLAFGWYIDWNPVYQEDRAFRFLLPGIFAQGQVTYRPVYDLGIGLTVYGSVNQSYSVAGGQVHLYFSTAYVRKYD